MKVMNNKLKGSDASSQGRAEVTRLRQGRGSTFSASITSYITAKSYAFPSLDGYSKTMFFPCNSKIVNQILFRQFLGWAEL